MLKNFSIEGEHSYEKLIDGFFNKENFIDKICKNFVDEDEHFLEFLREFLLLEQTEKTSFL